jgi:twitching motility protein PilT
MAEATPSLELDSLLRFALAQGISDVHLKPGKPPVFRRANASELVSPRGMGPLETRDIQGLMDPVFEEHHRVLLRERGGVDLGWGLPGLGRFRIAVFKSRVGLQAVLRVVPARIPTLQELGLPTQLATLATERRGLVLVTGATGSGKSTTLAALLDQINRVRACHIVTIEDPIEFVIEDRRAVVTQREILTDVPTFAHGLRAALRQDPDVILLGEMRDRETVETALQAAETGHLVMSTLHTVDARETVRRMLTLFDAHEHQAIRLLMSSVLKAVVSQRLVSRRDGKGRVPAVELMLATARIRDLLKTEDGPDILTDAIAQGQAQYGMQTFDQSLMFLYRGGQITYEEAMAEASNPADFSLRLKGVATGSDADGLQGPGGRDDFHF